MVLPHSPNFQFQNDQMFIQKVTHSGKCALRVSCDVTIYFQEIVEKEKTVHLEIMVF